MAGIKLKTTKRKTSVSRLAIRRAVVAAYNSQPSPIRKAAKKAARKRAPRKK